MLTIKAKECIPILAVGDCIMLNSEHLRSFFLLVLLSGQGTFATSYDQPEIKFNVSMEHDSSPGHLQQISLQCGWKRGTSDGHMKLSPAVFGSKEQVSAQESEEISSEWDEGTFLITVGDMSNISNYTSSIHTNGNISATFYIPRQTNFIGEFTCSYNSSNISSNFTNVEADLVFAYIAFDRVIDDSTFRFLFISFFCLFLVTLAFLIISCACLLRKKSPCLVGSEENDAKSYKLESKDSSVIEELPVKKSSPASSEERADNLSNISSNPTPCVSDDCPCSYYKQKLLYHLKQRPVQTPAQGPCSSDLGMSLSANLQGSLSSASHSEAEMDKGYFSVPSHLLLTPVKRAVGHPNQELSQAEDIDYGYASVSLHLPPLETENSSQAVGHTVSHGCSPRLPLEAKNHCYHSKEEVEIEASVPVEFLANDARHDLISPVCPADLHPPVSKVPPNLSGTLPNYCQDTSYPMLYPEIPDEVSGLSEEFDCNMRLVDPIETINLDSNGGRYANENHEVYVKFPKGFIPEGKTISVEVGVSFHSALVTLLPLESRPVSPLVKLCVVGEPNIRFLKPVEVTLPHFLDIADEEDVEEMGLQFLKSGHSLYCFHKSDGVAMFKPRASTATLRTKHFCTFCIIGKEDISNKKINYRLVKVVPKYGKHQMWRVNFCVTYYLRTCLQALRKQFSDVNYEMKTLRRFKFGDSGQLEINFERKLAGGWQMALESSSKINPEAVEYWTLDPDELEMQEEDRIYPPRFEVQVCGSQAREPITALICFRGMADIGSDTTELVLEPVPGVTIGTSTAALEIQPPYHMIHYPHHGLSTSMSTPTISTYYKEGSGTMSKTSSGKSFSNGPAHSDLMNFVAATLPTKWRLVGVQLGLSLTLTSLDEIERSFSNDCKRCFSAVFQEWELQNTSPYSWDTVVHVLQAPSVEENRVAEDVRAHFMQGHDRCSLYFSRSSSGSSSGYYTETHV